MSKVNNAIAVSGLSGVAGLAMAVTSVFGTAAQAQGGGNFIIIPAPQQQAGPKCYQTTLDEATAFYQEKYGEVLQQSGSDATGVVHLFADVVGDGIGEDDKSWTLVGQPYKNPNQPDQGVNENVVCALASDLIMPLDAFENEEFYQHLFGTGAPEPKGIEI